MTIFMQFQVQPGSINIYGRAAAPGYLGGGSYRMFVPDLSILLH